MKCPVCEKNMASIVCGCGYDRSRDYEKYPTFGPLAVPVESVAGLRERQNALVRCGECGYHGFTLSRKDGKHVCMRCGRALTEQELKPLMDVMGMEQAEKQQNTKRAAEFDDLSKRVDELFEDADPKNADRAAELDDLSKRVDALFEDADPKPRERIVSIAAGKEHTVALYADGTVRAIGNRYEGRCSTELWTDIKAIAAGTYHTVGLRRDGSVVAVGSNIFEECDVWYWSDIVAIAACGRCTVGLKADGTVEIAGEFGWNASTLEWPKIVAIDAGSNYAMGLTENGKVVAAGWRWGTNRHTEIRDIAAGYHHMAMLRDESVIITDSYDEIWVGSGDIAMIDAGGNFTVALCKDGTAKVYGMYPGERPEEYHVEQWRDLELIAAGFGHIVGLKKDGTLVATGDNSKGQCDVQKLMRL